MGRVERWACVAFAGLAYVGCSESKNEEPADTPGMGAGPATGGAPAGTLAEGTGGATLPGGTGGAPAPAGSGGTTPGTAGTGPGSMPGMSGSGGAPAGTGGAPAGTGGASPPLPAGDWPAADPAMPGPFEVTTEMNVGAGNSYTLVRPADIATSTRLHPVVTWGNGTGTMPASYQYLLDLLASHGFVVIASNSTNVATGTPPPMLDGVTWVFAQNDDPASPLHQRIDQERVGATGHSQGAFATSTAGADPRIKTIAPLQGARGGALHGPALLLCGGMDAIVPCSGSERAFESITVPVMYANLLAADHTGWVGSGFFGTPSPYFAAVTAWMRVHLMDDAVLRPMFYGASCGLCTDAQWQVMQKMMD